MVFWANIGPAMQKLSRKLVNFQYSCKDIYHIASPDSIGVSQFVNRGWEALSSRHGIIFTTSLFVLLPDKKFYTGKVLMGASEGNWKLKQMLCILSKHQTMCSIDVTVIVMNFYNVKTFTRVPFPNSSEW